MNSSPPDSKTERLSRKTFERAINLLTYRARSVAEMRERLMEKPWAEQTIVEQVIQKLLNYGYLNDAEFAREFAQSRLRQKPVGRRVLQQKLSVKKLERQVMETALDQCFEEIPETVLLDEAIARRVRTRGVPESREEKKKLFDFLLRQGFSSSAVYEKMRTIDSLNDS